MENKVIYLKSLVKNYRPKTETFSKEILKELEAMGIDLIKEKSGFLEPYNADVMKACEKSLAKSTTWI